ncbi:hypothetical protein PANT_13c00071 [Moesziomyces antarcticus T-34]|uniref:Spt20-like SEP domain-containing protein n=1 Tax=Pseudozyma antarctica (strain T-34) TaxID=1151754 RepID=M9ME18_PSEA3|nr:hypothetical protein PANT_13c00071 [Moesziomyces antarcticus T-34]
MTTHFIISGSQTRLSETRLDGHVRLRSRHNDQSRSASDSSDRRGRWPSASNMATTASVYNTSRTTRQILRRHRKDKPSLILHLHNNHFRFERQNGMFLFDSPVKAFLGFIRDQKVPADLIDVLTESGIKFFEGCLLVDVHDHRSHAAASASPLGPRELMGMSAADLFRSRDTRDPMSSSALGFDAEGGLASSLFYLQEGGRYGARKLLGGTSSSDPRGGGAGGVEIYRIVLHPTSETLWADIKMLDDMAGGMWTDQEALEVEAKILALTAPPLCLTPDPQATRIANLMLSATALPSAYSPSQDSPFRSSKKRGANSIEMEREEMDRQRREKIMRLMQHGHKGALHAGAASGMMPGAGRSGSAAMDPSAMLNAQGASASAAAATAFVPTFGRMGFIERWRMGRNAAMGPIPGGPAPGAAPGAANGAPGAAGKKDTKNDKEDADAGNASAAKKPPSKKKKKAQREKEEAEAAAAAEAAKKKAEEEAAAAAAAAKKPKKKLTKKEREEKERKEKEEKEKAEREEKERKEKEAAAAKGSKPKSKKKQKEEAAAAAAAAATKSPAKGGKAAAAAAAANGTDAAAPSSPGKDKKGSPKKAAGKKPAGSAAATTPAPASATKKKTPAKADKKGANANSTPAGSAGGAYGAADAGVNGAAAAAMQGTPILGSATPSVQSTPTPAHRSIPSQPQQGQMQAQTTPQMQQQQLTQQQLQQAALAGMFPNMQAQQMGFNNMGFGLPMMNGQMGGFPATSNAQNTAAALAAMQGMGMNQFGNANNGMLNFGAGGNMANLGQMQQMMGLMGGGFNGMPFAGQQQGQQQGQQPGQQGQQGTGDMPVGVGLAGLANWGTGK